MSPRFDIGFLGGGQLARMSIQAAQRMGLRCLSLDPAGDSPASQLAPAITGSLSDSEKIAEILRRCDRVTLENEFILSDHIEKACDLAKVPPTRVVPSITSLHAIQDKLRQRNYFKKAGVPSPHAVAIEKGGKQAVDEIGFPMVLKARFGGYDGKGVRFAKTFEEFQHLRHVWIDGGWMAEQYVPFKRELAVMVYIGTHGSGCFPTMETIQRDHVCDLVYPSGVDASQLAMEAVRSIWGNGLYGVELFELHDGSFQVNEIAPRPHNTGHYTLDWGGVSQFEQHVRLAMDWQPVVPHGGEACMANLLGQSRSGYHVKAIAVALSVPGVHFHWYGKTVPKEGRKMGHINAVGEGCVQRAIEARRRFYDAWVLA